MAKPLRSCPHCRALLDPDEATCSYCGYALEAPRQRSVESASAEPGVFLSTWLVGACVLLFVLEIVAAAGALGGGADFLGAIMNVPATLLYQMGGRNGPAILSGEWYRLIVPVFLHGGLLHLLFNGMALLQIGPLAEQAYGRSRLLIIYILSGIAGNVLGMLFMPTTVGIGASGAVFGLIGATGLYGHRRHDTFGTLIRNIMLRWGLFSLMFGFMMRGVDNYAHIGGLLAGLTCAFLLGDANSRPRNVESVLGGVAVGLLLATLAAFGLAVVGFS